MKATELSNATDAGRVAWTRDLARDLFPGAATPFAWTLLRGPADAALRAMYAELGASVPSTEPFWRFEHGHVYLNSYAIATADEKLCGAAWLGRVAPQAQLGLLGRVRAGNSLRRAQTRLASVASEAAGLQTRLSRWVTWVHGLRWTQADVLQVMEELEPHAISALRLWFLARGALNATDAQLRARLGELVPPHATALSADLYRGLEELPSVQAAIAVSIAARLPAADPDRLSIVSRYGHRGPGEMRPDARRWSDASSLLETLARQSSASEQLGAAQTARRDAERSVRLKLDSGQARQLDDLIGRAREAVRAADTAWDGLTMVMAAAQRWSGAAAREASLAGLISRPEDVRYLELEELKQVATGEWHGGRSAEVQVEVLRRVSARTMLRETPCDIGPVEVVRGGRPGPVYAAEPPCSIPPDDAIWLSETLDPGCLPFWTGAAALLATGCDIWSPGMIAARALGIPATAGVAGQHASA